MNRSILCILNVVIYREDEKNCASIDRKSMSNTGLNSTSSVANRMMTPTNHWVEQDSNSNQFSVNSISAFEKGNNNSWSSGKSSGSQGETELRDLDGEAAAHLLTKQEKLLCLQLDLKPTQYITQKALILQV